MNQIITPDCTCCPLIVAARWRGDWPRSRTGRGRWSSGADGEVRAMSLGQPVEIFYGMPNGAGVHESGLWQIIHEIAIQLISEG